MPTSGDRKYFPVRKLHFKPARFVSGTSVKWPLTEISFDNSNQGFTALIDSGASHSMLNADIAKVYKIKIDKSKTMTGSGVGSTFKYWRALNVPATLLGHKFTFDFTVPVKDSTIPWPCILGHDTIFQVAKIEFTSFKEQFKVFFRK